jgi:hypothetical protein
LISQVVKIALPSGERAIYLELETYLKSLEAIKGKKSAKSAKKSKKSSKGDRETRMQKVLEDSETAEEALVKRASHFNMSTNATTAEETCDVLVGVREQQLADCEEDLLDFIVRALRQRNRILALQPDWESCNDSVKGEEQDRLAMFLTDVNEKRSVSGGADNEVHEKIMAIVEKGRRIVDKAPKKYDADFAVANGDPVKSDDHDDDEIMESGEKRKRSSSKKKDEPGDETRTEKEMLYDMKFALRQHIHRVRTRSKELCGRIRSLRYLDCVRKFQSETTFECHGCHDACLAVESSNKKISCDKAAVFSCCGHSGCLNCLAHSGDLQKCVDKTCSAQVKPAHVVPSSALRSDGASNSGGKYGAKLTAIVEKVKELLDGDDRVIVFVQFRDLKDKVAEALEDYGVRTLQVKGSVNKQIKALDVLQKEKPDKNDPRCLLLTMDDESSAGVNLTTCNHALFVHPLLADTQQQYNAYETQAIGRIRRYGQTKTVHIWRYLAVDTIDTDIHAVRTSS